jgi:hypothetical protein
LDGVPLVGLDEPGNSRTYNVPDDSVLSGVLADGTPFALSSLRGDSVRDEISDGTLTLTAVELPPIGSAVFMLPSDPVPKGVRTGQTLVVDEGAKVPSNFNADWGSVLLIKGGEVGGNFEAVGANITISGGSVGGGMQALGGSTVNISGGSIAEFFSVEGASTVNVFGGKIFSPFEVYDHSEVNVSGGTIVTLSAKPTTTVNISGGSLGGSLQADGGSTVKLLGGSMNDLHAQTGSNLEIFGGDFSVDGIPIDGLANVGSNLQFKLMQGTLLSGTLADGTPFALSSTDSDEIADGTLTLATVSLPPITRAEILLPGSSAPQGLRSGQTLIVNEGGVVPHNFNAGKGSSVVVAGGVVGPNFEAVGADISVRNGSVGFVNAFLDTTMFISGGSVNSFVAEHRSTVTVSGGSIGARNNPSRAQSGSEVNILGGSIGPFQADAGSTTNLIGTRFVLDNKDITNSLTANIPVTIADRNVSLSGFLVDGSPFSFDLNTTQSPLADFFDARAILTITLVPEPPSILMLIAIACLNCLRRKRPHMMQRSLSNGIISCV